MPTGYERREKVQDPNANRPTREIDTVPLSPVQAPRHSSFTRVGENERELAQVLGKASVGFTDYMQKKADEWRVEGQMAYAEGKTEEEIAKSGNRYTVEGYKVMQARTLFNKWALTAGAEIDDTDHQMNPEEYKKKLSGGFKEYMNQVGDDPAVRSISAAMAEKVFPDLVSKQVIANNKYREDQTANSYTGLLVSEGAGLNSDDPDSVKSVQELLSNEVSGLNPERHQEAVGAAISLNLKTGNGKLFDVLGLSEKEKISALEGQANLPKGLLGAVMAVESRGKRYAKDGSVLTSPKGAKGEMQVMDKTNLDPGFGVRPAKDNSLDERARVGRDYLAALVNHYRDPILGVMAYNSGAGNVDAAIAKNGDPRTGKITHDAFVDKYPLAETRAYVKNVNSNLEGSLKGTLTVEAAAVNKMLALGFSPKTIEGVVNDYNQAMTEKANQFDKQRFLDEQAVLANTKADGNYSAALDSIQQLATTKGYGDKWAVSMAGKAATKVEEYQKEYGTTVELKTAMSNNRVGQLSSDKQQKAIELKKAEVSQLVDADPNLNDGQRAEAKRTQVAEFLVNNNVVDKKWAAGIEGALSGNILNKDGSVKKEAISAFADYQLFSKLSTPAYASKYLGESKDLVALAESYDGGGGMTTGQALSTAAEILSRKQAGSDIKPVPINADRIHAIAKDMVNDLDSWLAPAGGDHGTGWLDLRDHELELAKNNPILPHLLTDAAMRQKIRNPNLPDQAALVLARNEVQARTEFALGNILVGGKDSTIKRDMGLMGAQSPTAVNEALLVYMRQFGEKIWGDSYNQAQFVGKSGNWEWNSFKDNPVTRGVTGIPGAVGSTIMDTYRGVPDMLITYDADRKGFIVDLYENKEANRLRNAPHFIPAKDVGSLALAAIYTPEEARLTK